MDKKTIDERGLGVHFDTLLANPAYLAIREEFEDDCLRATHGDMQLMAEKYIAESAIKSVFRAFERYNKASLSPDVADQDVLLEPEYEDINDDDSDDIESIFN
jgi:hypothetical protein